MNVAAVLDELNEIFENEDARFAVIGGHALLAHGVQRVTFDLDVLVRTDDQERLVAALEKRGFTTLHRSSGFSNHAHSDPSWGRVDVVYVDEQSARRIFGETENRSVAGRSFRVPSPRVLAAMKLHAISNDPSRRLQDLADIRGLLEQVPESRSLVRGEFLRRDRAEWLQDVGLAAEDGEDE